MKYFVKIFVAILCIGVFSGCTLKEANNAPQKVVEDFFKYKNEKNVEKMLALTPYDAGPPSSMDDYFENLISIKVLKISEITNEELVNSFFISGRGSILSNISKEDLKIYEVEYQSEYKDDSVGVEESGIYSWDYYVGRDKESGEWLIVASGLHGT